MSKYGTNEIKRTTLVYVFDVTIRVISGIRTLHKKITIGNNGMEGLHGSYCSYLLIANVSATLGMKGRKLASITQLVYQHRFLTQAHCV